MGVQLIAGGRITEINPPVLATGSGFPPVSDALPTIFATAMLLLLLEVET